MQNANPGRFMPGLKVKFDIVDVSTGLRLQFFRGHSGLQIRPQADFYPIGRGWIVVRDESTPRGRLFPHYAMDRVSHPIIFFQGTGPINIMMLPHLGSPGNKIWSQTDYVSRFCRAAGWQGKRRRGRNAVT
jgi:hypothetical protein